MVAVDVVRARFSFRSSVVRLQLFVHPQHGHERIGLVNGGAGLALVLHRHHAVAVPAEPQAALDVPFGFLTFAL